MVKYGKTLSDGIRFSIQPKKWLPFFILDSVTLTVFLAFIFSNASLFKEIASQSGGTDSLSATAIASIAVAGIGLFAVFIVYVLIRIYIGGAIIHQSVKPKETKQSWTVAKERYFTMLAVIVIVSLATSVVGGVPYIGWVVSIIVGLLFFFALPPTIVDKKSFDDSIRTSIDLFREKTADVFLSWLLITIVATIIFFIFAVPLLVVSLGIFLPYFITNQSGTGGMEILNMLIQSGWSLYPATLVLVVGYSISNVFSLFAQTNLYQQLKKRKLV